MTKKGKKLAAVLLAVAMVISFIQGTGTQTAYADDSGAGNAAAAYIDADDLGEGTIYGLSKENTLQAVYFGKNGDKARKWWIAGNDGKGLVLMCDPTQPLQKNVQFDNTNSDEKNYSADWGCIYSGETPTAVYRNNYGGSYIRNTVLKSKEKDISFFSAEEQGLMKEVPVHTYDNKAYTTYSTDDKLYLGAANYHTESYITVGSYEPDSSAAANQMVNNGLKIGTTAEYAPEGSPYASADSDTFWLRTQNYYDSDMAIFVRPGNQTGNNDVNEYQLSVVPAFDLDYDAVLFASSAEAGTGAASLDEDNVMTLRYDGTNVFGSTATFTSETIKVNNTDPGSVYLYVQGEDDSGNWVYSKEIAGDEETIKVSRIHSDTDLSKCRIWLEKKTDNVAYAKFAQKISDISGAEITGIEAKIYTGKPLTQNPVVTFEGATLAPGTDYTLSYKNNTNAGTSASVTITGKGNYSGAVTKTFTINKAANPLKIGAKTATVKYSKLKKKTQTLAATKVIKFTKKLNDKKTYTLVSAKKGSKSFKKYFKINKTTGKVTIKKNKKMKKGTYKVKVKVKAAGNANYKPSAVKTVTFKVKVK